MVRKGTVAMNFFQLQDDARARTRWMVGAFIVSAILTIAAVDGLVFLAMSSSGGTVNQWGEIVPYQQADYLFAGLVTTFITASIIGFGSLYKTMELSHGGETVALAMGAKRIDPATSDFAERRLLNIVHEMALASGVPVPPVYVMEDELGINAFAAGFSPDDAVVAVTRGCMELLTRDELQGVVAHEFSHILNGDMRLDIRMMGLLNGILVIFLIGTYILRNLYYVPYGSSRDDNRGGGGILAIMLFALGLVVVGSLGWFLGQVIKASVSRQREFLADASAVQFTRNPEGIGGALKKIGGIEARERAVHAPAAVEASHMFLANISGSLASYFLATHPPLVERIRRILPDFDGHFPKVSLEKLRQKVYTEETEKRREISEPSHPFSPERLGIFAAILAAMDPDLKMASEGLFSAQALVLTILLDRKNADVRQNQWETLHETLSPELWAEVEKISPQAEAATEESLFSLVDLAIPTLKQMSLPQYQAFREQMIRLILADGEVDLREYILQMKVIRHLDIFYGLRKQARGHATQWTPSLQQEAVVVFSRLAYNGNETEEAQRGAWEAAVKTVDFQEVTMVPAERCDLRRMDAAFQVLDGLSASLKQRFLEACMACVMADGRVVESEVLWIHGISAVLGMPLPVEWNEKRLEEST